MRSIRNTILRHARVRVGANHLPNREGSIRQRNHGIGTLVGGSSDQIMDRVLGLVKKYDKIDASKVSEKADFQKDLSLDSLDKVELVMAIEEEFSIEIPDEKADKLTCCSDIAEYIISESASKTAQS